MSEKAGVRQADEAPEESTSPNRRRGERAALDGFEAEWFSGEWGLQDLEAVSTANSQAPRLVLIRFLAVQYFTNLLRADWPPPLLRLQRSAALNALGPCVSLDRELRALRAALEGSGLEWRRSVVRLLLKGGAAARSRPHAHGAVALYRIAFEASVTNRWWAEAAAAALGIAELGQLFPDPRVQQRWARRAGALARSAARAEPPS